MMPFKSEDFPEQEVNIEKEKRALNLGLPGYEYVIHDLKSPLASANAIAQLLRHQAAKGRLETLDLASRLSAIEAALRRGALRVDELMDLAMKDDAEASVLQTEPVDLIALVGHLVDRYRLTDERHEFVHDPRIDTLVGDWDRDRIERSVDNLVSNAVKYSPNGGRITATVSEERTGDDRTAVVTVADQGLGIPVEEREAIFERFRRGSNVADVAGSGVGLWSVRRIVEQHGGNLGVQSRIGQGSSVTMRLPLPASHSQCPRSR